VSVKCRDPDGYVVEFSWEPGWVKLLAINSFAEFLPAFRGISLSSGPHLSADPLRPAEAFAILLRAQPRQRC
jgi:hypothetical protein